MAPGQLAFAVRPGDPRRGPLAHSARYRGGALYAMDVPPGLGQGGIYAQTQLRQPSRAKVALDRAGTWFGRHWLAVINGVVATFIGLAILTPIAYAVGLTGPASAVFDAYRFVCAQTPSHSFYIAGFQCCLCARCLSIYCSLLFGGLLLAFVRRRGSPRAHRALDWKLWFLSMVPMALDGGTQLFGWRESNVGLRILTGVIFGLATAWFMLPQIQAVTRAPSDELSADDPALWTGETHA